ncbi:hypothetical protein LCY76_09300 [Fictibacillus sp. KIGAM418]|uniref:Uncharacterized protein n=1 Tax=Fictibacillus marinisediminis TaxID=2878389 RepID=A0A9X1XBH2_9BACL|nr:hypothetical protein [Fictibacillus marinisediminis]MCK6256790.1 hypothetical protein [Fictibacillus marinisediminis]
MDKSQMRKLYRNRQQEKSKKSASKPSLFEPVKKKKGCKTCGKVTWKPKKNNDGH